jgi:hypothetical protein
MRACRDGVVESQAGLGVRGGLLWSAIVVAALSLAACEACKPANRVPADGPSAPIAQKPTLRLYFLSNVAGALEPCGCVKDQLGGLDHAAAFMRKETARAPNSAIVAAGPLLFMNPKLETERREQDVAKARTLAKSLGELGLVAAAPGINDFAGGDDVFGELLAGTVAVASNAPNRVPATELVRDIGGVKVGFLGAVRTPGATDALASLEAARARAKAQGAQILIVLAATGRGEAKRIADRMPDVAAIVVGAPESTGEVNTDAPSIERIGDVLVLETGNHLQQVGVVDFFVKGDEFRFEDGTGVELAQKRQDLGRKISDLRAKIAMWEQDKTIQPKDLEARRADLVRTEAERRGLDATEIAPKGSFVRARIEEVRESLGKDQPTIDKMLAYYKSVNAANRERFKDRLPRPVEKDEASFVGIDVCTGCHSAPRAVWDKTAHAHAYETLTAQHKEFNLDCVSCHVTGYDQPGGSTVTHVDKLTAVQCEVCHGPGSKHAKSGKKELILRSPKPETCTSCHHPPHVHAFDPGKKWSEILGPGHGLPASASDPR